MFNTCLVNVLPDGQVVFADNFGRGYDWLSLNSISFIYDRNETGHLINLTSSDKFHSDEVLTAMRVGTDTACVGNAAVSLKAEPTSINEVSEVILQLPEALRPCRDTIPVTFLTKMNQVMSLSHIIFQVGNAASYTSLSDTAGYYLQEDMVHLCGQLTASQPPFVVNTCLLTLPSEIRPLCCHDFLVCGAGDQSSADAGGGMVRLLRDGRIIFMGTSLDSPLKDLHTFSLDGIRFLIPISENEKSSDPANSVSELKLNSDISMSPIVNRHSKVKKIQNKLKRCPCSGKHGTEFCPGSVGCPWGCSVLGHHAAGSFGSVEDSEEFLNKAKLGGYAGCDCKDMPCTHVTEAVARHDTLGGSVDLNTIVEDAAAGGYTTCACNDFPCDHMVKAATKARQLKGDVNSEDIIDFGQACAVRKFGCGYLCGQVFKRRPASSSKVVSSSLPSEGFWEPGMKYMYIVLLR